MQFLSRKLSARPFGAALVIVLLFSTGAGLSIACAQEVDTPKPEKHLALIIANQDYDMDGQLQTGPADMPPPGFLKDLANPCNDAELFEKKLLDAHWQAEEIIYPGCNQGTTAMRKLITDFREKVANSTGTLFIFYYSGHGAQFGDHETSHSFLFGVGAKLNLVAVADSFRNSPGNSSAIANQAIDLDELLKIGDQPENAVLIILDACRNNPLYGQIDEIKNAPSIAPLGATLNYQGIVIAYSAPAGEFSGDGFGQHSIFTAGLVNELRPDRTLDDDLNFLRKAVAAEYKKAYPLRTKPQVPFVTGRFSGGGWCLTQCYPPISRAPVVTRTYGNPSPAREPHAEAEVRKSGPAFQRAVFSLSALRVMPSTDSASFSQALVREVSQRAARQAVTAVPSQGASATQASASVRTIYDKDANKRDYSVPASSGMQFDVFWCDGGDGSGDREKRALDIASALGQEATARQAATTPTSDANDQQINQSIVSVRLRRLTAVANTASGFRYSDNLIIYDKSDKNEVAWSNVVGKLLGPDLNPYGDTAKTPNYMSIFVCRAPQATKAKTLIYLQVPAENLKPSGRQLLKDLTHMVPSVKNAGGIETRSDGPMSTELRFYNEEERDSVFATAKAMEKVLERPVKVQFIPRLATAGTAGHMEIWIGQGDLPLDEKMLKTIPPKNEPKE